MKRIRVASLLLGLVLVSSVLAGCSREEKIEEEVIVETTHMKDAYEFTFNASQPTVTYDLGAPSADKSAIRLYLGGEDYFSVEVPNDIEYVTDYSKYLYAVDNSFSVTIISNVGVEELATKAGMVKFESIDQNVITTPENYKGVATISRYLPAYDKAIIVRGYDLSTSGYATARESLIRGTVETFKNPELLIADMWTQKITSLPIVDPELVNIAVGIECTDLRMYKYEDGYLNISKELRSYEDTIKNVEARLCIATNENIAERYFKGKSIYYAEMNGFTVGVVKVNFNTAICLFGYGEAANANIVYYLKDFKG